MVADVIDRKERASTLSRAVAETWSIADVGAADWPHAEALKPCTAGARQVVVVVPLEAERYRVVSNTDDALAALPAASGRGAP